MEALIAEHLRADLAIRHRLSVQDHVLDTSDDPARVEAARAAYDAILRELHAHRDAGIAAVHAAEPTPDQVADMVGQFDGDEDHARRVLAVGAAVDLARRYVPVHHDDADRVRDMQADLFPELHLAPVGTAQPGEPVDVGALKHRVPVPSWADGHVEELARLGGGLAVDLATAVTALGDVAGSDVAVHRQRTGPGSWTVTARHASTAPAGAPYAGLHWHLRTDVDVVADRWVVVTARNIEFGVAFERGSATLFTDPYGRVLGDAVEAWFRRRVADAVLRQQVGAVPVPTADDPSTWEQVQADASQ